MKAEDILDLVCAVFKNERGSGNQTEIDMVNEVVDHVRSAEWFRIYDLVEVIYESLSSIPTTNGKTAATSFESDVNAFFKESGVGWQLDHGVVEARGEDAFEASVRGAVSALAESGRTTASGRIREALDDLSRRPIADLAGAIDHSIAAVECVLGDAIGSTKGTLGDFLKQYSFDPALKKSVEGLWGYACNQGARHGREGVEPDRPEAEFVLTVCAALASYLNARHPRIE
jgi:hypothetical protein